MAQQVAIYPIGQGLNYNTAPLFLKPGEALYLQNFVPDFNGGYRRPFGYERFDGQPRPSDSTTAVAIAAARALIAAVPGSGDIRGLFYYNNVLYAFRDNAGGTATVMYKSSASGWTAVSFQSYIPFNLGTAEISDGASITNAGGAKTATVSRVFYYNTWAGGNATGRLYISASSGAWATSDQIQVGGVQKATATGGVTAQTLTVAGGYETVQHNFYGASDRFRVYGVDGVNKAFEFDGTNFYQILTGMTSDVPTHICQHKNYLWLSFAGGSLQSSGAGTPNIWSVVTGATEISQGQNVTALISTKDVLVVYGRNRIKVLYGSSSSDWQLKPFDEDGGALAKTVQSIGGDIVCIDDNGVSMLSATQNYGDFNSASISERVKPLINSQLADAAPNFTLVSKRYGMYMIFFDDKTSLMGTFLGTKIIGYGTGRYNDNFVCGTRGEDTTGIERMFVGGEDGMVYELERGTSSDGDSIEAVIRLPFGHLGRPAQNKRIHRFKLELNAPADITLSCQPDLDYGAQAAANTETMSFSGIGSYWGTADWDEFTWDGSVVGIATAYVSGVGVNIGFVISQTSATVTSYTIAAAHIYWSPRAQDRG